MAQTKNKTILVNGLPGIYYRKKWIIYSPLTKNIIVFKNINNLKKIKEILDQNKDQPRSISYKADKHISKVILITTNACNLKCRYCYENIGKTKVQNMDPNMAIKIIDKTIKPETKELKLIFFGGEPTLNLPLIKTCVDHAKSLSISSTFQISTNGVVSKNILDYLLKEDFTIQISTDGIPLVQDLQRPTKSGVKSSIQVKKTIKYLVGKKADFKVRMTVTPLGLNYLTDCVRYFADLGVKYIHIESVSSSGDYNHNDYTILNYKKFAQEFIKVLQLAKRLDLKIINSTYMNIIKPSTKFCGGLCGNQIVVNTDGNISVCYEVQNYCHPDANLLMVGHYDTSNSKLDIKTSKLDNILNVDVNKMKKCQNCFAKFICSGGCPIRNRNLLVGDKSPKNNPCDATRSILYYLIKETYLNSKKASSS